VGDGFPKRRVNDKTLGKRGTFQKKSQKRPKHPTHKMHKEKKTAKSRAERCRVPKVGSRHK